MNVFRFLNVGQGLFYSGRIDVGNYLPCLCNSGCGFCFDTSKLDRSGFRFVYDCGSNSPNSKDYIIKAINNDFYCKEDIDLLFISHLHDDHINGIWELNKCTNIKNIVLPYVFKDNVILFTYLASITTLDITAEQGFFNKIYNKLSESSKSKIHIDGMENYKWEELPSQDKTYTYRYKIISLKSWKFYLINKSINQKIIDNIKTEIKAMVGCLDLESIKNFVASKKDNIDKIKDIYYKNLGKNKINLSSTVVIHHPKDDLKNVTMLTGDAEFDGQMIRTCKDYLKNNNIKYLQAPHHGAFNNWRQLGSLKDTAENIFISFGLGNIYKHPSTKLLNELHSSGRPVYLSTQSLYYLFLWNQYIIH